MNARELALAVVRDVFPADETLKERGAQEAMEYRARRAALTPRDRAFATELAYGSIKMRRTIDWYLQPYVGGRNKPLPPAIGEILRIACYEFVFTSAAEHATVNEFVGLAKKYGHRGTAGLVNAVLRSFLREKPPAPARESFADEEEYLGTRYSFPTWMVRQWRARFGDEKIEDILTGLNSPAQTVVVVNGARTDLVAVRELLDAAGAALTPSAFVEDALVASNGAMLHGLERGAAGAWWLQGESAAMPVDILNPQPDERVLDVCSGRGNKALQSAARLAGSGSLTCIESDARKVAVLQTRLSESGLAAAVVVGDATQANVDPDFDRILVDAPCSGTGIVGRHPEARWRKRPDDGERLAIGQRALLDALIPRLFAGGTIVYAVCSTDLRETSEVIEWALRAHNVERGLMPARYEEFLTGAGDVLVPPGIGGRDGFFIARLERRP